MRISKIGGTKDIYSKSKLNERSWTTFQPCPSNAFFSFSCRHVYHHPAYFPRVNTYFPGPANPEKSPTSRWIKLMNCFSMLNILSGQRDTPLFFFCFVIYLIQRAHTFNDLQLMFILLLFICFHFVFKTNILCEF